jgi:predicted MFS family arabinose efflux permease
MISPFTRRFMGWSNTDNSYWFACVAVLSLVVSLVVRRLSAVASDRTLLLAMLLVLLVLQAVATAVFTSPGRFPWFAVTLMGVSIAAVPTQIGTLNSALSKSVAPALAGELVSYIMMVGTLGRIVGPLWGGNATERYGIVWAGHLLAMVVAAAAFAYDYPLIGATGAAAGASGSSASSTASDAVRKLSTNARMNELQMRLLADDDDGDDDDASEISESVEKSS